MGSYRDKLLGLHSGYYEWELQDFQSLKEAIKSPTFEVGGFLWCIKCHPLALEAGKHWISLFVCYVGAGVTPTDLCPKVQYRFTIKNHKQLSKSVSQSSGAPSTFTPQSSGWGYKDFMLRSEATTANSFLRADGVLVVRVELVIKTPKRTGDVGADLLSLLDAPGPTSDLTLRAGDRSFPVHRAILAARCPYFNTLFGSDFADSGSREHELQEADPEALELLLRYIYGGVLECPPELLKPAAQLADRLLLMKARAALQKQVGHASTVGSLVEDLLWAHDRGAEALLTKLEQQYVLNAPHLAEEDVVRLAERNPRLMGRLHMAVARAAARPK